MGISSKDRAKLFPGKSVIVKYTSNRKMYSCDLRTYVTLNRIHELIMNGRDFVVIDSSTNDDVTNAVLGELLNSLVAGGTFSTETLIDIISLKAFARAA